jgi:hypothetical protein
MFSEFSTFYFSQETHLVIDEHVQQRLKPLCFTDNFLEVVKGTKNNFMSPLDEADGGKKFQHQRLRSQRLVDETQRNAVDGFAMLNHHVEAVFVVHDGTETHNSDVNVVGCAAHIELLDVSRTSLGAWTAQHFVEFGSIRRDHRESTVRWAVLVVVDVSAACVHRLTRNLLLGILKTVLDQLFIAHHLQPKAEIVDERVQALILVIKKLFYPLDVIRSQRDFQISEDLRRC